MSESMSQGRSERTEKMEEIKKIFSAAESGVLADFRGLKVSQITDLRRRFYQKKVSFKVLKNTLVKIAVRGTPLENLAPMLEGPTGIAFGKEDPVAPAKVAFEFAKEFEIFKIKGGFLSGKVLSIPQMAEVAKLPGRLEMMAGFLGTLNSPAQYLLGVLNGVPQKFLGVLQAREDQLGKEAK